MDIQVSNLCSPDVDSPSSRSESTAESLTESRRPSISPPSQASDGDAFYASDDAVSDWEGLPAALLQLIGAQLAVSDLASGRQTCASWRTGLSLGVESLAPLVHDGKAFLDPARWGVLHKVRPLCMRTVSKCPCSTIINCFPALVFFRWLVSRTTLRPSMPCIGAHQVEE